mgnify:FL=1
MQRLLARISRTCPRSVHRAIFIVVLLLPLSMFAQVEVARVDLPNTYSTQQERAIEQRIVREGLTTEGPLMDAMRSELGTAPVGPARVTLVMTAEVRTFSLGTDDALRPQVGKSYTVVRGDTRSISRAEELMALWSDTVAVLDTLVLDLGRIKQVIPDQLWLEVVQDSGSIRRPMPFAKSNAGSNVLRLDRSICDPDTDRTCTCQLRFGSAKDGWFTSEARFVFPSAKEMDELASIVQLMKEQNVDVEKCSVVLDALVRANFGTAYKGDIDTFIERRSAP